MPESALAELDSLFAQLRQALDSVPELTGLDRAGLYQRMDSILSRLNQTADQISAYTEQLQELNKRLGQAYEIIESSDVVVFEWTLDQDIPTKFVTDNIRRYGYEPEDFYRGSLKDYWDFIHPDDRPAARQLVYAMRQQRSGEYKHRYRVVCKDGSTRWVEENTVLDYNPQGEPVRERGILYDITTIKQTDERIEYLSYHDKLTGLYNRAWFEEKVRELEQSGQYPFSVILGDMNGLKVTNDLFGHRAGDELLVTMARILRSACRESDTVCRLGGDEFVVLLPGFTNAMSRSICQRIHRKCREAAAEGMAPSIALGIATSLKSSDSMDRMLSLADSRMYRDKLDKAGQTHGLLSRSLQSGLQTKTGESQEHVEAVRQQALNLAQALDLSVSSREILASACLMHDIGKSVIPSAVLLKAAPLSEEEWVLMRKHSEQGCRILAGSANLQSVGEIILHHHERWDGGGYPERLAGDDIPLLSRILAIADAFVSMQDRRPYREPRSLAEALAELSGQAGKQFDPELVRQFLEFFD